MVLTYHVPIRLIIHLGHQSWFDENESEDVAMTW